MAVDLSQSLPTDYLVAGRGLTQKNGNAPKLRDFLEAVRVEVDQASHSLLAAKVASTANVASRAGLLTIDAVVLAAGDVVLLKDQSTGSQNGLYVAASGAWARLTDSSENDVIRSGQIVVVTHGTANADSAWMLTTNAPITVGTTSLAYASTTVGPALSSSLPADLDATPAIGVGATAARADHVHGYGALSIAAAALAANAVTYPKLAANVHGAAQLIATSGATAISLSTRTTHADGDAATDDITSTLAVGTMAGQRKTLILGKITALKDWVITPTAGKFFDGTTITLDAAGDWVELEWNVAADQWLIVGGTGYTVA